MDAVKRKRFFEDDLPDLMKRLNENHMAKFGIMEPQHMLEHLIWTLQSANGSLDLPIAIPEERLPKFMAFLDTDLAIMPNFKNPLMDRDATEPLRYKNLDEAKKIFWQEWQNYQAFYTKNPDTKTRNPVYGWCGKEDWDKLHFKHFLHHFEQFGLVNSADYGLKPFERK